MKTKDGKRDLESEIIARCVKAIELEGRSGVYRQKIGRTEIARVLRYLADRFGTVNA